MTYPEFVHNESECSCEWKCSGCGIYLDSIDSLVRVFFEGDLQYEEWYKPKYCPECGRIIKE